MFAIVICLVLLMSFTNHIHPVNHAESRHAHLGLLL